MKVGEIAESVYINLAAQHFPIVTDAKNSAGDFTKVMYDLSEVFECDWCDVLLNILERHGLLVKY